MGISLRHSLFVIGYLPWRPCASTSDINSMDRYLLLCMRPPSHKSGGPGYVTLHGLHDSKGSVFETQNSLPHHSAKRDGGLKRETRTRHTVPFINSPRPA